MAPLFATVGGRLLLCLLGCLSVASFPESELEGRDVEEPFPGCPKYKLGGRKGFPMTRDFPFEGSAAFAFYPITSSETMLSFHVMFPSVVFKFKIEGSMLSLEECNSAGRNCAKKSEEGVKYQSYVTPQMWNEVKIRFDNKTLTIYVGPRMIKSMSMISYQNLHNSYVSVVYTDGPSKKENLYQPALLYLVQYKCKELTTTTAANPHMQYVTTDTAPRTEYPPFGLTTLDYHPNLVPETTTRRKDPVAETTTEYSKYETPVPQVEVTPYSELKSDNSSGHVGLIVGLVVAAVILLALGIVIYNVVRKRQSHNITETSPIAKQQEQQTMK